MINSETPKKPFPLTKKQILVFCAASGLLLVMPMIWLALRPSRDALALAFNEKLQEGSMIALDLRDFNVVEWDEITYWPPYGNICDLKIDGYTSRGENCESSEDDGESYLLFLNKNHLIGKVFIDRAQLDLAESGVRWRVKKSEALFVFDHQTEWPTVTVNRTSKPSAGEKPDSNPSEFSEAE
jgi:hypothetical protein